MSRSLQLREQAERCRRLARDSTDDGPRDSLLTLAEEYIARAAALENVLSPIQTIETTNGANQSRSIFASQRDIVGHAATTHQPAALALVG
jgi:hypothetical protein